MDRKINGSLVVDYVKVIRKRKDLNWDRYLTPEDKKLIDEYILDSAWYSLDSFERISVAVFKEIGNQDLNEVRLWGRTAMEKLFNVHQSLICEGDPMESLMRFHILRRNFFNYDTLKVVFVAEDHTRLEVFYQLSPLAEKAFVYQALGYFERLLELSGAGDITHIFQAKAWEGAPVTVLDLNWTEMQISKKVKGIIFLEYVRMIKSKKETDWSKYLTPRDLTFLTQKIHESEWYPFDTFERMGVGILNEVAAGNMDLVRMWGQASIDDLLRLYGTLVCEGDPRETLMRFQVLRRSFFDFNAITIQSILENYARIEINYGMCKAAEEAATWQAIGFFERLLELSGANNFECNFKSKLWEKDPATIVELIWF